MKKLKSYLYVTVVVVLIQIWRITSAADPPPEIQSNETLCFYCNERKVNFNWTYQVQSVFRIQWKFEDIFMANKTNRTVDLTQESLSINQNYRGRFTLLTPGDVGFSLTNLKRADLGTYRCIVTLDSGTGITLQGGLEERRTDRREKVKACSDEAAIFKWTRTWEEPFQHVQWQFNETTIANTTKEGISRDSLRITAEYKPRFHLLQAGDVGFRLETVSSADAGTYASVITFPSGKFNIIWNLEVEEVQSGNLSIVINQETLSCGEERKSDFSWVFLNVSGVENVDKTGHALHLPSVPTSGWVYCFRQSDCTTSSIYNFTRDESVKGEDLENGTIIILITVVLSVLIVIIVSSVVLLWKRAQHRAHTSNELEKKEADEEMLPQKNAAVDLKFKCPLKIKCCGHVAQ
ncbi:uncharacterized protein LOC124271599 isoform X1 [Haliotis rubra]|uniref:uncharacterized protein LOC124271599 isoform X1 n=1 Tax=Haliotis rubra TaxID=36100 RepID=UPI001EE606EC|nr:uncharacterized protein LOC124271599 isoform X1 [Haliotis rubra]